MTFTSILLLLYWLFFTVRTGFSPRQSKKEREAVCEIRLAVNANDERRKKKAERFNTLMKTCGYALKVIYWIEHVLLVLCAAAILYTIGAVITGNFVFLGYPI